MSKHEPIPNAAKKAEQTMRYFEERGREVIGVTIKGQEFKLDFAREEKPDVTPADLVDMSK